MLAYRIFFESNFFLSKYRIKFVNSGFESCSIVFFLSPLFKMKIFSLNTALGAGLYGLLMFGLYGKQSIRVKDDVVKAEERKWKQQGGK